MFYDTFMLQCTADVFCIGLTTCILLEAFQVLLSFLCIGIDCRSEDTGNVLLLSARSWTRKEEFFKINFQAMQA